MYCDICVDLRNWDEFPSSIDFLDVFSISRALLDDRSYTPKCPLKYLGIPFISARLQVAGNYACCTLKAPLMLVVLGQGLPAYQMLNLRCFGAGTNSSRQTRLVETAT